MHFFQKIKPYSFLFILILSLLLASCHSSRNLTSRQADGAYRALKLEKSRKDKVELYIEAANWLGTPHRDGGLSPRGIDCSGLVYIIYKKIYGKTLQRNSKDMMEENCSKKSRHSLREGDLVFFNTGRGWKTRSNINHVGIYLKDNKFIHASTSRGVMISDLDEDFFKKSWVCGGRVK